MVITALLVTVLLAEHRWQAKPSSRSSLLGNLNKRTIQAEMDFRRSVSQLPAQSKRSDQVAQCTDKLYWSCYFPGWTSPFSHLLIGQVLQLRLVWPSTGLPPVGRSLSIPEGPKTEQSIQMGSQESWTERDSPSFNILAFSPWLLSWGFVGHFQSWSTSLAYNQLVSARAHRSFPVEMPLIRPQPVSLLPAQGQSLISVIVAFHETFLPISILWLGCSG